MVPAAGLLAVTACGVMTSEATTGTLVVRVATTGVEQDPDGYTLSIDGLGDTAVAINARLAAVVSPAWYDITDPSEGEVPYLHLALSGVATNCVADGHRGLVYIHAGMTDSLSFTVTCSPTTTAPVAGVLGAGTKTDRDQQ
jgi:hypothetical protein